MVRGIYTAASGMLAQTHRMDALSNNLANVDTTGYKQDTSIQKAFPQLLIRRVNNDGVYRFPFGSMDVAPVVGNLGTGVELNEVYTKFTQGALQQTENSFDLALDGEGFFSVSTPQGERYTRNGSFTIDDSGYLVTKEGLPVMGLKGPVQLKKNNFVIDSTGSIYQNSRYSDDPRELVSLEKNQWENMEKVDQLRVVDFQRPRYLKKQGSSLWKATDESGIAQAANLGSETEVKQGFLEKANVNPVTEMVRMIEVNRSYEANQKVIQSHDQMSSKLINQVAALI